MVGADTVNLKSTGSNDVNIITNNDIKKLTVQDMIGVFKEILKVNLNSRDKVIKLIEYIRTVSQNVNKRKLSNSNNLNFNRNKKLLVAYNRNLQRTLIKLKASLKKLNHSGDKQKTLILRK